MSAARILCLALLLVATAANADNALLERLQAVEDGKIQIEFEAREGVWGDGRSIMTFSDDDDIRYSRHSSPAGVGSRSVAGPRLRFGEVSVSSIRGSRGKPGEVIRAEAVRGPEPDRGTAGVDSSFPAEGVALCRVTAYGSGDAGPPADGTTI